ncbi:SPOR domain-containing protein [Sphingomonas sp. CJ20]
MSLVLSPVGALDRLFKIDRKIALPLVAGMAVIAAVTVIRTWDVSFSSFGTTALVGVYIIGLGLLLTVIASVIQDKWLKQILGVVLVLMILCVTFSFFLAVFFRPPWIQPPWCLSKFWIPCSAVEAELLRTNGAQITARADVPSEIPAVAADVPATQSGAGPGENASGAIESPASAITAPPRIFIQFAGLITRDSVKQLNAALRQGGWDVQGGSGERTPVAAGLNEVRYAGPDDEAQARALAEAVTKTGMTATTVVARQVDILKPGTLELWISN